MLFTQIWDERPHKCTVCGKRLPMFSVSYFMHLMSKGSLVQARLDKDNIVVGCYDCHFKFDHQTHMAKEDSKFDFLFEGKEKIKQKYLNKDYGGE